MCTLPCVSLLLHLSPVLVCAPSTTWCRAWILCMGAMGARLPCSMPSTGESHVLVSVSTTVANYGGAVKCVSWWVSRIGQCCYLLW
jgi:hypothetical protein